MQNVKLKTLKEGLENTLRYWYETISESLFVESLEERLKNLEEMKSLILAITTIKDESFNPKDLKTIHITTRAKFNIVLEYDNEEKIYNLIFKGTKCKKGQNY